VTGSIRNALFALKGLLKTSVATAANRVFVSGETQSNLTPRIFISAVTPVDNAAGLGATRVAWKQFAFRIDVYGVKPQQCDIVADEVMDALADNRYYNVATVTLTDYLGNTSSVSSNGYFAVNRVTGGTENILIPSQGVYRRVVNLSGRWMQTA
jgi:hypothetical protein